MRQPRLTTFAKIVIALRIIRTYNNHAGWVWQYWNPLAWVMIPLTIVASILFSGIPETFRKPSDLGFGIDPFYINNPKYPLEWD